VPAATPAAKETKSRMVMLLFLVPGVWTTSTLRGPGCPSVGHR
jgi:hypothetical protein